MNEVTQLLKRIEEIQKSCQHEYTITKYPKNRESLIANVLVGYTDGPTMLPITPQRTDNNFQLQCTRCSKKLVANISGICHICLNDMKEEESLEDRKKYFGREYSYNSVRVNYCSKDSTHPRVVNDEWDQ